MKLAILVFVMVSGIASVSNANDIDKFVQEMTNIVLDGGALPNDIQEKVEILQPADRYMAIVFLRRSGLMTGAAWSVDELLRTSPHPPREGRN